MDVNNLISKYRNLRYQKRNMINNNELRVMDMYYLEPKTLLSTKKNYNW